MSDSPPKMNGYSNRCYEIMNLSSLELMFKHPRRVKVNLQGDLPNNDSERFWFSSGVRGVAADEFPDLGYVDHAYIPRAPWIPFSDHQKESILGKPKKVTLANVISIIDIDPNTIELLSEILKKENKSIDCTDDFETCMTSLIDELQSYVAIESLPKFVGFKSGVFDIPTVTWDRKYDNRPGLHIDSWDRHSANGRTRSSNRICINLGPCDRYFLFVNLGVDVIQGLVQFNRNFEHTTAGFVRNFFSQYPDHPVIKMKIKPGEAYVAPTEYIIHDAYSGKTSNSSFTIRGHFRVR